jgi:hypothetical protein
MIRCLGCGRAVDWDGRGNFAYTCLCGATMLIDDNKKVIPPVSFVEVMVNLRTPPHIDYYLGVSNVWSPEKEEVYNLLRSKGATWSWECEEHRSHAIERARMMVKWGLELHPDLARLL